LVQPLSRFITASHKKVSRKSWRLFALKSTLI